MPATCSGEVFTDEVALLIYDRDPLDDLLQAKWNAMKARLAAGDVPGAVIDFSVGTKPTFEYNFSLLSGHMT